MKKILILAFAILFSINLVSAMSDTYTIKWVVPEVEPTFDNLVNHTHTGNTSFSYDLDATDTDGISCFTLNDTSVFEINCTGWIENATVLENVKLYWLNVSVNDTLDNTLYGTFYINVTAEVPVSISGNITIGGIEYLIERIIRISS